MLNRHEIQWNNESIANLWNFYSQSEQCTKRYFARKKGRYLVRLLKRYVNLNQIKILDYGSGPGYLFDCFLKTNTNFRYFALDYSLDSIGELNRRLSGHRLFGGAYHIEQISRLISGHSLSAPPQDEIGDSTSVTQTWEFISHFSLAELFLIFYREVLRR